MIERVVEIEDLIEVVDRVARLLLQPVVLDEGEDDRADVLGAANVPAGKHAFGHETPTLQRDVAHDVAKLLAGDVAVHALRAAGGLEGGSDGRRELTGLRKMGELLRPQL